MDFSNLSLLDMRILVNNTLLLFDIAVVIIMGVILWQQARYNGWYTQSENKLALALLWIYFFTGLTRLWGFILLKNIAGDINIVDLENKYQFALWFTLGIGVGLACLIRILTHSNRQWIIALLFVVLGLLVMSWI